MLYIDDQLPHIQQAKSLHIQNITCYVNRKLYGKNKTSVCGNKNCIICNSKIRKTNIKSRLYLILSLLNIEVIAGALPQDLIRIHNKFERLRKASSISLSDVKIDLEKIFNYEWFIKKDNIFYNAYDLTKNLKIETCVYCNRLYTSTIITDKGKSIIRPTLDHWFSQNDYPILALSFYNLIPSCSPCNSSVKHTSKFTLKKNIHPYEYSKLTNDYKLKSTYDTSLSKFKIIVDSKVPKIISTLEEMKIAEIYGHHQSELSDLDLLQRKFNKSHLKNLNRLLGTNYDEKDVYRIMFGVEYDDENFHKRPLSKLKKDILNIEL